MAGKKRNALKHGANATEVMLWSERHQDYEALRDALYQEFTPCGSTEEYLVRTLLDLRWRRRRLECHEQIVIQQRLDRVRKENEYSHHVDNLRSFAPKFGKATSEEQVEAVLATLSPIYRNTIRDKWPFKSGDDSQKWGPQIAEGLTLNAQTDKAGVAAASVNGGDSSIGEDVTWPKTNCHQSPNGAACRACEL